MQVTAQSRNPVRYGKGSCAGAQVGRAVPLLAYTMTGNGEKLCTPAKSPRDRVHDGRRAQRMAQRMMAPKRGYPLFFRLQ